MEVTDRARVLILTAVAVDWIKYLWVSRLPGWSFCRAKDVSKRRKLRCCFEAFGWCFPLC